MNSSQFPRAVPKWLLGVIAAMIVLILAFIFRDFVRQSIIVPILYLGWLGSLLINSLDQSMLWIVLSILVVIMVLRMLFANLAALPSPYKKEQAEARSGRVAYWRREISIARHVDYLYDSVYTRMRHLLYEILANQYRMTPAEVEAALQERAIQAPEEVYAFLERPSTPLIERRRDLRLIVEDLLDKLGIRTPWAGQVDHTDWGVNKNWAFIIHYLEDQMELTDDH